MSKIILIAFILTSLLATTLQTGFGKMIVTSLGYIIVPDDYEKIQWAVGNATAGDTISVRAGTYYEHVVIDKSLTLIGENKNTTVIDGDGYETIIYVQANNVAIRGFTIQNAFYGIYLDFSQHTTIRDNKIDTYEIGFGIQFDQSSNNILDGNTIINNALGIYLTDSSHNIVSNNTIEHNSNGVSLEYSNNNTINNNIIENSEFGLLLTFYSDNNSIYHNRFLNNYYQMYIHESFNNIIYHNSFVEPMNQIFISGTNTWDDGYPSGGNYWSNYADQDLYGGPNQNEAGSDGIWDNPYIMDASNKDRYPLTKPYPWDPHDIGITTVITSKTVVGQGRCLHINVTIFNYGMFSETFNVTTYTNETIIGTLADVNVTSRKSTTITFRWETTGFAKGDYTISSNVTTLPDEADTADNTLTDGTVTVVHPGDLDNSGQVDIADVVLVTGVYRSRCGDAKYRPNSDIIEDCVIDIADVVAVTAHYREKDP